MNAAHRHSRSWRFRCSRPGPRSPKRCAYSAASADGQDNRRYGVSCYVRISSSPRRRPPSNRRAARLMERYADRPMDLADATLVVLAEERGSHESSRSIATFTSIGSTVANGST